jgi:cell cycle checkpoint protein
MGSPHKVSLAEWLSRDEDLCDAESEHAGAEIKEGRGSMERWGKGAEGMADHGCAGGGADDGEGAGQQVKQRRRRIREVVSDSEGENDDGRDGDDGEKENGDEDDADDDVEIIGETSAVHASERPSRRSAPPPRPHSRRAASERGKASAKIAVIDLGDDSDEEEKEEEGGEDQEGEEEEEDADDDFEMEASTVSKRKKAKVRSDPEPSKKRPSTSRSLAKDSVGKSRSSAKDIDGKAAKAPKKSKPAAGGHSQQQGILQFTVTQHQCSSSHVESSSKAKGSSGNDGTFAVPKSRKALALGASQPHAVNRPVLPSASSSSSSSSSSFTSQAPRSGGTDLWVDKHRPRSDEDLAVFRKKVTDVEGYISHTYSQLCRRSQWAPRVLILQGPCGSGKTATVCAVADKLGFDMVSWNCSAGITYKQTVETGQEYTSDLDQLITFLKSAMSFSPLEVVSTTSSGAASASGAGAGAGAGAGGGGGASGMRSKTIVVVEDFPHMHDASHRTRLQDAISELRHRSRFIVVFIVSEDLRCPQWGKFWRGVGSMQMVVTLNFIKSNASLLKKCVTSILAAERVSLGDEAVKSVVASADGDVRSAINALQMACYGIPRQAGALFKGKGKGKGKGRSASGAKLPAVSFGRDPSKVIFSALGRVLHCKREPSTEDGVRGKLSFVPEDVVQEAQIGEGTLCDFLHYNYPSFFGEICDVAEAADCLSDADILHSNWEGRATLAGYAGSIASRGLLHSNTQVISEFRALHKPPRWQDEALAKRDNAMALFGVKGGSKMLLTEVIPMLGKRGMEWGMGDAEKSCVRELTTFEAIASGRRDASRFSHQRGSGGAVGEGEAVAEDEQSPWLGGGQSAGFMRGEGHGLISAGSGGGDAAPPDEGDANASNVEDIQDFD